MVNLWKRSMSITPTAGSAAPKRSGRCVMHAPTSRPPLLPPPDGQLRRRRVLVAISHSAAAMKSSKTFCFFELGAGLVPFLAVLAAAAEVRHARRRRPSPSRRWSDGLKLGVSEMLNPP